MSSSKEKKFEEIQEDYERFFRRQFNNVTVADDLIKIATNLLKEIREAGSIVIEKNKRQLLKTYAKDVGLYIFKYKDELPETSLDEPNEDIVEFLEPTYFNKKQNLSVGNEFKFYGRRKELADLERAVLDDRHPIVAVTGAGGIGKTALLRELIQNNSLIKNAFGSLILRRSLRTGPSFNELLGYVINDLEKIVGIKANNEQCTSQDNVDRLLKYLRDYRCLIVFDDFEGILAPKEGSDTKCNFRKNYETYGSFLSQLGRIPHQSCLVLTSRELPVDLEKENVKVISLLGLSTDECLEIFTQKKLDKSTSNDLERIVKIYAGNPLAINLVATSIYNQYDGYASKFLDAGRFNFGEIESLFDEQFLSLSFLEKSFCYWLALEQYPSSVNLLLRDLECGEDELQQIRENLRDKAFIEEVEESRKIALHESFKQHVIRQLIEDVFNEILYSKPSNISIESLKVFDNHPLLKASSMAQVRGLQGEHIIKPLSTKLLERFGSITDATNCLKSILRSLQKNGEKTKYAVGNIINLLSNLDADFTELDFSGLTIREAHFHGVSLHRVNFEYCKISDCNFEIKFGSPLTVAFSPRNQYLGLGNANGAAYLFKYELDNTKTGKFIINSLNPVDSGHIEPINSDHIRVRRVVFSQDGKLFASTGDDAKIRIYSLNNLDNKIEELQELADHKQPLWSIAFSPDTKYLVSAGEDPSIKVWEWIQDSKRYQFKKEFTDQKDVFFGLAFHKNSNVFAHVSQDGKIGLRNLTERGNFKVSDGDKSRPWKGRIQTELDNKTRGVRCVDYSLNGQWLAVGDDQGRVMVWRVSDEKANSYESPVKLKEEIDNLAVLAVTFSVNSKYLACCGDDEKIHLYKFNEKTNEWEFSCKLSGHSSKVWSISFSFDSKYLVSCSDDQTVRFWSVEDGRYLDKFQAFSAKVLSVAFHPQGEEPVIAGAYEDQKIRIWNVSSKVLNQPLTPSTFPKDKRQSHRGWLWSVAYSPPDGKFLVSSSDDETIRIWDADSGEHKKLLKGYPDNPEGHSGWVRSICFSPDGKWIASGSDDCTVKIWNFIDILKPNGDRQPKPLTLKEHKNLINSVSFNQNGKLLASASNDKTVKIWHCSPNSYEYVCELKHKDYVRSVCFSPSDPMKLVTGSKDGVLVIWDLVADKGALPPKFKSKPIFSSRNVPDCHKEGIWAVIFSPDGEQIVSSGEDKTIKIWDVSSGKLKLIDTLTGHDSRVRSVAFSKDGRWLASASEDETIRLWEKDRNTFKLWKNDGDTTDEARRYNLLRAPRPYEGMKIKGICGLLDREIENLKKLGAIDEY
jgi:WD40 repeat protein